MPPPCRIASAADLLQSSLSEEAAAAEKAAAAADEVAVMSGDLRRLQGLASRILSDCTSWCERHSQTLRQLSPVPAPVLTSPPQVWCSSEATTATASVALWLVGPAVSEAGGDVEAAVAAAAMAQTSSGAGVVGLTLRPFLEGGLVPGTVVLRMGELDVAGNALLQQRDHLVMESMTSLLQYAMVLKQLLPGETHIGAMGWGSAWQRAWVRMLGHVL